MTKSTTTYWNALHPENRERWTPIKGMEGKAEELTLSIDQATGEYTSRVCRSTRQQMSTRG